MRKDFIPVSNEYDRHFRQSVLLEKLLTERDGARSCVSIKVMCERRGLRTIAEAAQSLNPIHIFQEDYHGAIVEFKDKNFAIVKENRENNKIFDVILFGDLEWALNFRNIHGHISDKKACLNWFYSRKGDISCKSFDLEKPLPVYDEFYPYIDGGVEKYLDSYLAGRPSILILIGPPGTGKTSLLRHLLWSRNLTASVTFDEAVIADEEYFINFASNSEDHDRGSRQSDIMIVEDADLLLSSRESEQNKTMAKLLNVSEGLIPLDRKKMIFTTNLPNINKIDPALIRPGRCFDVLHFRPLLPEEAEKAANVAGLTLVPGKKEMTLADLFNSSRKKEDNERFKLLKTA